MSNTVEREKPVQIPEGIIHQPESLEIPEHIEKLGVTSTPTQPSISVGIGANGQPAIQQQPNATAVTVTIPNTQAQLADDSKGSVSDSSTWRASYWLRILKKALFFGWQVIVGGQK